MCVCVCASHFASLACCRKVPSLCETRRSATLAASPAARICSGCTFREASGGILLPCTSRPAPVRVRPPSLAQWLCGHFPGNGFFRGGMGFERACGARGCMCAHVARVRVPVCMCECTWACIACACVHLHACMRVCIASARARVCTLCCLCAPPPPCANNPLVQTKRWRSFRQWWRHGGLRFRTPPPPCASTALSKHEDPV